MPRTSFAPPAASWWGVRPSETVCQNPTRVCRVCTGACAGSAGLYRRVCLYRGSALTAGMLLPGPNECRLSEIVGFPLLCYTANAKLTKQKT
eukprot:572420-Rhodomonas_salina.1